MVYKLYDDWEEWITSFIQLKELVDAGEKKYNSFRDNFGLYIKYPSPVTLLRKRIGFYSLSHFKKTLSDFGIEEVLFSITHNRGCFGACNFCSLAFKSASFDAIG